MLVRFGRNYKLSITMRFRKRRPKLYTANAKDPQKQAVYHQIVRMLNDELSIKAIAEKNKVTRMTVYRIKKELDSNLSSELIDS
ncbi:helix-turn-helix domain-containing protein [Listeria ivanovii]|uniref:helix-turn-helix domain-containing protein n=2 Tax=Listeria ivanovii TaxID=1638 RepID=UPI001F36923B|nr:helix-turn-helix domain-containing protein [Listeria ivanovii]